jgi:ferritin-like protein
MPVTLAQKYAHRHFSVVQALRWLDCGHLPDDLRVVADVITVATDQLMDKLEDGPQLTRGLHALIEARDCMVRQAVLDAER